jgi:hypothetical protein
MYFTLKAVQGDLANVKSMTHRKPSVGNQGHGSV